LLALHVPALAVTLTCPANTPTAAEIEGIQRIEGMSVHAMRFGCVSRRPRVSAEEILSHSHGFKMIRVHTTAVATQMINGQP
jgi:hypothetical protein